MYFQKLNFGIRKIIKNNNALALIIGVENYESKVGKAVYAENDSNFFKNFAIHNLGISKNNIKILNE